MLIHSVDNITMYIQGGKNGLSTEALDKKKKIIISRKTDVLRENDS